MIDRYVLLSGQDYPLYAQKDLQTYFAKHADVEFIRGFAITDKNQDYFKIQQRHFMKPFFHNKKTDRFLHHLLRYGITKNRLFYKKTDLILQGQTYTVYGGGQWHALTHAFASYMMDLIDTQPKLLTYFQTSYAPDEMLFQTIDRGLIEASQAMGSSPMEIIFRVYLKESIPGIIRATTITLISLIGLITMVGAVGGGGIGDFAIRYGYNSMQNDVTYVCVIILLLITTTIQGVGNILIRKTTH